MIKIVSQRRVIVLLGGLALASATSAAATERPSEHGNMRDFDAVAVARYELNNWIFYYQRRWRELFLVSLKMLREAFGLSLPQALRAGYWVLRAEMAAAPREANVPLAEAYMRKFYRMVRRLQGEPINVRKVAALEVNWWVVHRALAISGVEDKGPLEDALAAYYATLYRVDVSLVREAAHYRALAMTLSDRWVGAGSKSGHPLLAEVEEALRHSYRALGAAVGTGDRDG